MMDTLLNDLRFALRLLRRSPGFALAAVLTLALGIGANTAMFSVVHAVLLRPLPYPEPERLLRIRGNSSAPDLKDLAANARQFEGFAGYRPHALDIPGEPLAERVDAAAVSGDVLPLLGVPAAMGRVLTAADDVPGGERVVLLMDSFWRQRLGADPAAVGRSVRFVSGTYRVVGVMPRGFKLPQVDDAQVIAPIMVEYAPEAEARGAHTFYGFGRVRPGVTLGQAQAEMNALQPVMAKLDPAENRDRQYILMPLHAYIVRNVRTALLLLFGAVGLVLLIAAVNVVNLLLARAAERQREMAIRTSLGASRGRIIRQLLAEGLLLSAAGAAAGLAVASWMLDAVVALGQDQIPALVGVGLDTQVLAFTAAVAVGVAMLFALAPGLQGRQGATAAHLKDGMRATGSPGGDRVRRVLVASEVALSVVLLAGAGLLLRSLHRLQSVEPGFETKDLLTFRIALPMDRYRDIPKRTAFADALMAELAAQPGIVSAGATSELPFADDQVPQNFMVEGAPPVEPGREPEVNSRSVTPAYFHTMGIPILRGRGVEATDTATSEPVGVVNETAVRLLFDGKDPVGRRVMWAREDPPHPMTVVGVVGDVRGAGLDADDAPAFYTPLSQERRSWRTWMYVTARTALPTAVAMAPAQAAVARADRDVPITRVRTMDALMTASWGDRRFNLWLLAAFALLALTLAGVGIHGVISYAVARRTREIGVRMALGARAPEVLGLVLRQGLLLAGLGVLAGLAGALALRRVVAGMLFGVAPSDPLTLAAVAAVLLAVALVACYAPARRAANVDPAVALRCE
jgi:putative ABC transport system permease protein